MILIKRGYFYTKCKNLMSNFDIITCKTTTAGNKFRVPIALELTMAHKIHRPKEIVYEKNQKKV